MTQPPPPPGPSPWPPPGDPQQWPPPSPHQPHDHGSRQGGPGVPPVAVPKPSPAEPMAPPGQSPYGSRPAPAGADGTGGQPGYAPPGAYGEHGPPGAYGGYGAPGAYGEHGPPGAYGQSGGYGQFTFPELPKAKVEPLAVAGLVTAVLGLPGLVLGLLAVPRVKGGRRRSPALAWSAVILGALFTIGWILTFITLALTGTFDRLTEQPQPGDVSEPRTIASATLAEGNCITSLPPARPVGDVRVVPCEQLHIAQVISVHQLDGSYPGDEVLQEQAASTCAADLDSLQTDMQVIPWYLVPSDEGWQEGNTQLMCLARAAAGSFDGDLLG